MPGSRYLPRGIARQPGQRLPVPFGGMPRRVRGPLRPRSCGMDIWSTSCNCKWRRLQLPRAAAAEGPAPLKRSSCSSGSSGGVPARPQRERRWQRENGGAEATIKNATIAGGAGAIYRRGRYVVLLVGTPPRLDGVLRAAVPRAGQPQRPSGICLTAMELHLDAKSVSCSQKTPTGERRPGTLRANDPSPDGWATPGGRCDMKMGRLCPHPWGWPMDKRLSARAAVTKGRRT